MRYLFLLMALVSFSLQTTAARLVIGSEEQEDAKRNPTTARFVGFLHYYKDQETTWTALQLINDTTWLKRLIVPKIQEDSTISDKKLMAYFLTTTAVACINSPDYTGDNLTLFNLVESLDPPTRHFKGMAPVKPRLPTVEA